MTDDVTTAQAFYARWARLYDLIATFPGVGSWRERAADALALEPGDTVVEMGCGTGANLPSLRERVGREGTVIGIDFTRGMLDRATQRVERAGWTNVHLIRADVTAPPIAGSGDSIPGESGSVDAILSSFVVGMLAEPAQAVDGWLDLLEPDGRAALLDATRSADPRARGLDAAFRLFVAASTPPATQLRYEHPPWERLAERVTAARRPLVGRAVSGAHESFALGFVRLSWGQLP